MTVGVSLHIEKLFYITLLLPPRPLTCAMYVVGLGLSLGIYLILAPQSKNGKIRPKVEGEILK